MNALFRWINDPKTVRLNSPFAPIHEPNHRSWFDAVTRDADRIVFAIRELNRSEIIGVIQLVDIHPIHRSAELIIRIGEEGYRNKGFGTEALQLAVKFAFEDRNLQRIWLHVFSSNGRAIKAYEKAGFRQEGVLRRACYISGGWVDLVIMAMLADEK